MFVVPKLLTVMESVLLADVGAAQKAEEKIISLYNENKEKQIAASVNQEIKYQLSLFDIGTKKYTANDIKMFIDEKYSQEKLETIVSEKRALFDNVRTFEEILRVFNFKSIANKIVGEFFGLKIKEDYPKRVLRALGTERKDEIIIALNSYIPNI